jgi:hypothetical protein
VRERYEFILGQEQEFHPAFDGERVHGKAVLPKAEAKTKPGGSRTGFCR